MTVDAAAAAAAAAASSGAAIDALVNAELSALAADAQALQQQVAVGDVVTATVLPSNGFTDLINILGNRVAASLPPTVSPGDQITVKVTGFNGPQILLQILATSDGTTPAGTPSGSPIPIPNPSSGEPPGLTSAPATTTAAGAPATSTEPTTSIPSSIPIAPPASAFVAASVRPNAPVPPPIPPGGSVPEPAENAPPGTIPGAAGTTIPAQVFGGIEARLAAARAASVQVPAPPPAPAPGQAAPANAPSLPPLRSAGVPLPPPPPPAAGTGAPPAGAGGVPQPVRSFAAPPPLVTARFADPAPAAPPAPAGQPGAAATAPPPTAAAPARTPANFQDPIALVRALKLPVTPSNIAAAKLAIDTPQRLPAALATLESALPQSDDPRIATLRTITAFIGKIEPSSPQLATQIAAYVEHVVSGSEPQLAQLLNAYAQESATLPAPAAATDATATAAAPDEAAGAVPAGAAVAEAAATEPALPVVALAQIVERAAAIAVSLKEQIFSLVSGPAAGGAAGLGSGSDVLVPAAASALSAVTSVQLAAAQAALANPQTMTFAIPMWLGSGVYAQAKLAVDRDAPDTPSVPLDGDNFHIAFVLDTKHLGTVAIDLRTVGRAYSLSVKTETLRSAQRFGDELSRLTDRLSSLRYQSKSVEAVVAASATPAAPEPVPAVAVVTDAPSKAPADLFNESA